MKKSSPLSYRNFCVVPQKTVTNSAVFTLMVLLASCARGVRRGDSGARMSRRVAASRLGRFMLQPGDVIEQHSEVDARFTMTSMVDGVRQVETPPPSQVVADTDLFLATSSQAKDQCRSSGHKLSSCSDRAVVARGRGGKLISVGDEIKNSVIDALAKMTLYLQLDDTGRAVSVSGYDAVFDNLRELGLSESTIKVLRPTIVKAPNEDSLLLNWNNMYADLAGRGYIPDRPFQTVLTFSGLLGTVKMPHSVTISPVANPSKTACPSHDCVLIRFEAKALTEPLLSSSHIHLDEAFQINTSTPSHRAGIRADTNDTITTHVYGERIHDRKTMHMYRENYTITYDIDVKRPIDQEGPLHWAYTETHETRASVASD